MKLDGATTTVTVKASDVQVPELTSCKLVVKVHTDISWSTKYFYAWDSNDKPLKGDWPGTKMSSPTTEGSYKCYTYEFDKSLNGTTISYIINNGNEAKTKDLSVKLDGATTTVTVAASDVQVPELTSCKLVVKVSKSVDWYDKYIYAWDANETALADGWPGAKLDFDGEDGDYYVYHHNFDKGLNGSTINYIINGGNGSGQTNDLSVKLNGATTTVTVNASDVK